MIVSQELFAAEYVLPGHPDKLCDAIADGLVEQGVRREKRALCGVEVAVHMASVFVTGRIACRDAESIDPAAVAREVYRSAGYGSGWAPEPDRLEVHTALCLGPLLDGEAKFRALSDDQSIVTGYATDSPATNWLPPEQWIAAGIARKIDLLRSEASELRLGPDGKLIVVYDAAAKALAGFSASMQQAIGADEIGLNRRVREVLARHLQWCATRLPGFRPELPESFHVNGAGNFEVGGPEGDNGLSGKKLVVDAYGPRVPIGGGALSGKDFFKADRAGALLARRVAKVVVMAGVARECTATLSILPGDEAFRIVSLKGFAGERLDPRRWSTLFDLRLETAGERHADTADLISLARYGHFTDPERAWEMVGF
jgi:S-adenosylmethionine synthetase